MDVQQALTTGLLGRLSELGIKLASTGGVTVVQQGAAPATDGARPKPRATAEGSQAS